MFVCFFVPRQGSGGCKHGGLFGGLGPGRDLLLGFSGKRVCLSWLFPFPRSGNVCLALSVPGSRGGIILWAFTCWGPRESTGELGSGQLRIFDPWGHEPQNQKFPQILGSGMPGTLPILGLLSPGWTRTRPIFLWVCLSDSHSAPLQHRFLSSVYLPWSSCSVVSHPVCVFICAFVPPTWVKAASEDPRLAFQPCLVLGQIILPLGPFLHL